MDVKKGYKQTENGVIPVDWEVVSIQDLVPKNKRYGIVDGPFGSNLKTIHYRKSGIPIITSGYVTDGVFNANEYLYVDEEKFKQEKRSAVNGGDIVMAKIGERCGASAILPHNHPTGILSGNALKISIDKKHFSSNLIWQILWSKHNKGDLKILRTTGAQPAISIASLKKYLLNLPQSKAEQTAIATALSDVDALISRLETLIAKKRAIKQGAMQQLLKPKEGWEMKKLGEIAEVKTGNTPPTYDRSNYGDEYFFVSPADLGNGKYISDTEKKLSKKGFALSRSFPRNSILFTCIGSTIGKCGIALRELTSNQQINAILPNEYYVTNFVYYTLEFMSPLIRSSASEQAVPLINKTEFEATLISIPNRDEQMRIAQMLSDMDAEIAGLEQKLSKYKRLKQGMMQELLTGKTRLV